MMEYVDRDDPDLSLKKQCEILGLKRNRLYYKPKDSKINIDLMKLIDQLYIEDPTRGTRRLKAALKNKFSVFVGRAKIRMLMRRMAIAAIYPKKDTSIPHPAHKKYPYLTVFTLFTITVLIDNIDFSFNFSYIKLFNYLFFWIAIHQLGYFYAV